MAVAELTSKEFPGNRMAHFNAACHLENPGANRTEAIVRRNRLPRVVTAMGLRAGCAIERCK